MNKLFLALLLCLPSVAFAASSACPSWPTNMAIVHLKNAGITAPDRLDESKTNARLLMREDIEPGLWRQIYEITFHEHAGREIQVITENYAIDEECSMSGVAVWVVGEKLGDIQSLDVIKKAFRRFQDYLVNEPKADH